MFSNFKKTIRFLRWWCAWTDTLVNKFSNLSALVAQTLQSSYWDSTWFMITSKSTMTLLKTLFIKIMIWWLIWDNIILDRFTHKCSFINWSRKACRQTHSVQYLFVWVYCKGCLRFSLISSSPELGIHAEDFQRRELLKITHAFTVEPRWWVVTEWGKKKEKRKKREPKFKPRPRYLISCFKSVIAFTSVYYEIDEFLWGKCWKGNKLVEGY